VIHGIVFVIDCVSGYCTYSPHLLCECVGTFSTFYVLSRSQPLLLFMYAVMYIHSRTIVHWRFYFLLFASTRYTTKLGLSELNEHFPGQWPPIGKVMRSRALMWSDAGRHPSIKIYHLLILP
jgi:hypothetical protein